MNGILKENFVDWLEMEWVSNHSFNSFHKANAGNGFMLTFGVWFWTNRYDLRDNETL